jgi:hypothetical protein
MVSGFDFPFDQSIEDKFDKAPTSLTRCLAHSQDTLDVVGDLSPASKSSPKRLVLVSCDYLTLQKKTVNISFPSLCKYATI